MRKKILALAISCLVTYAHAQVKIITTFAGTGGTGYSGDGNPATTALFNRPNAVCIDKFGNIYTADAFNHVVRQIDKHNVVSTVGGTGAAGYSGEDILAVSSQLKVPQGICLDSENNIYVSDAGNNRIRKITRATGLMKTVVGTGTHGFSGDNELAVNAQIDIPGGLCIHNGALFFCDNANNRVRKVELSTGIITTVAGSQSPGYSGDLGLAIAAQLNSPCNIAFDNDGNMYISDQYNYAIRRVKAATNIITTIAGIGTAGYSGDSALAIHAALNEPTGLFIDKHNNLYIADYRNGAIRKIDLTTDTITTIAGGNVGYGGDGKSATDSSVKLKCTDVCVDDNDNIYIADYVNQRIRIISSHTANVTHTVISQKELLTLYPNPTKGKFTVQTASNQSVITIYNTIGKLIQQIIATKSETEVDISTQPPGTYLVYVQLGEEKYVSKVVNQ